MTFEIKAAPAMLIDSNASLPAGVLRAGEEYVQMFLAQGRAWELHAMGDLPEEYESRKLTASLNALGNPFAQEDIEREFGIENLDGRASMIQLGRILMQSLVQDVRDCLSPDERATLQKCYFSMVDIGESNALCAHKAVDGTPIPGYVVLVNQGLYFCLKLLVTAQIFEDLEGSLAKYKRPGDEMFAAAREVLLSESPQNLNVRAVETGDPEVDGIIESGVSLGATLIMQFVMLHEVGHAHLQHGKVLDVGSLEALAAVRAAKPKAHVQAFHDAEFEADAFAWTALARRADTDIKNFANLYVIRLFFAFLGTVEDSIGRPLGTRHPPPLHRASRLVTAYAPDGLGETQTKLFNRQSQLLGSWSGQ